MAKVVEIPQVGNVEFPDSMSDDQISAAAEDLYDQKHRQNMGSPGGQVSQPKTFESLPDFPFFPMKGFAKLNRATEPDRSTSQRVSDVIEGGAAAASPWAPGAVMANPLKALLMAGAGMLAGKTAGLGSEVAGADPDTSRAVENSVGLAGGGLAGLLDSGVTGAGVKAGTQAAIGQVRPLLKGWSFWHPFKMLPDILDAASVAGKRAKSAMDLERDIREPLGTPAAPGGGVLGPDLPPGVDTSAIPKVSLPSGRQPGSIANASPEAKPVKTWKKLDLKQFSNLQKSLKPESPRPAAPGGGLPGELPSGRAPGGIQNQTAPPEMPAPPPNLRPKVPAVPGRTWKGAPAAPPEPTDTPVPVVKVPKNVQALLDKLSPEHKAVVEEALKQEPAAPVEDLIQPDTAAPDIPEHMQDASRPDIKNEFHQRNRLDLVRDIHHELRSTGVTLKNLQDIQSSPAASKNFWDAVGYKLGKKLSPETIQHAIDDYEGPGPRAFSRGLLPDFATANEMTPEEAQSQLEADGWKVA